MELLPPAPNPVRGVATVAFSAGGAGRAELALFDHGRAAGSPSWSRARWHRGARSPHSTRPAWPRASTVLRLQTPDGVQSQTVSVVR